MIYCLVQIVAGIAAALASTILFLASGFKLRALGFRDLCLHDARVFVAPQMRPNAGAGPKPYSASDQNGAIRVRESLGSIQAA